jgi:hypothetical protein
MDAVRFDAFVADIHRRGILVPLEITAANVVLDESRKWFEQRRGGSREGSPPRRLTATGSQWFSNSYLRRRRRFQAGPKIRRQHDEPNVELAAERKPAALRRVLLAV